MNNKNFIITHDKAVGDKLKNLGFQEILSQNVDICIFVNDNKISFANDIDMSKIKYSNKLFCWLPLLGAEHSKKGGIEWVIKDC